MGLTNFALLSEQAEGILRYAIDNAKNNLVYFGGFGNKMIYLAFKDELETYGYLKKHPTPVLSGPSHILTSSGRDYFVNKTAYQHKEAQEMFIKLTDDARELLLKLIEHKDSCGQYFNDFYFSLSNDTEKDKYTQIVEYLSKCGYLEIIPCDGAVMIRNLTYSGRNYCELEREYIDHQKQAQNQHLSVIGTNVIVQTGNNNTATIKSNDELSKVIDSIRSLLTNDIADEHKELILDNSEAIQEETQKPNPKKGLIKTAINGLRSVLPNIKNSVELTAAITSIIQFAMTAL